MKKPLLEGLPDEIAALSDAQMAEVDRRLAEHERNLERASPWSEVLKRIKARFET